MSKENEFELTREHIKLARELNWVRGHYDAPEVDQKRPYGNSNVVHDIARIIDLDFVEIEGGEMRLTSQQEKYCLRLHEEMYKVLEVILTSGNFKSGTYALDEEKSVWKRVLTKK